MRGWYGFSALGADADTRPTAPSATRRQGIGKSALTSENRT